MKKCVVIAGFPGIGKTWCVNNLNNKYKMEDSDSSSFSWLYNENKIKTDIRNPEFPNNYIKHIISRLEDADVIFVSTHKEVRKALADNKIPYVLVYPENNLKNKKLFIDRYINRGNNLSFVENIKNNWENYINDMKMETWPVHYILASIYEPHKIFLRDILDDIIEVNSDYYKVD